MMKKKVVEIDEREIGVRRILNFGHTIGHGIESYYHLHDVYHGEAVALGMMKMIKDETIREISTTTANRFTTLSPKTRRSTAER